MGCPTAGEDMTHPLEFSDGCKALGKRSEGQSLAFRRPGVREQPRGALPAPLPAEPNRAYPGCWPRTAPRARCAPAGRERK